MRTLYSPHCISKAIKIENEKANERRALNDKKTNKQNNVLELLLKPQLILQGLSSKAFLT